MEALKVAINVVIALLLVAVAVTLMTRAIESTTKKSWRYDHYGSGSYTTLEMCIEEEMLVRNIREDEDTKPYSTTCRYR